MTNKLPKVYYQMKMMKELCELNLHKIADKTYANASIHELSIQCEDMEASIVEEEENFTGDHEDYEGLDVEGLDSNDEDLETWDTESDYYPEEAA